MNAKMNESQLQTKLLKGLKKHGWFYKASDRFRAGIPDVIGCYQGRFAALELKVAPRKVTPLQHYELKAIYREGGHANVVSYNNKTKLYSTSTTEHTTLGDLIQCILKQILSSIRPSASKI
jgi:hypothetical protein